MFCFLGQQFLPYLQDRHNLFKLISSSGIWQQIYWNTMILNIHTVWYKCKKDLKINKKARKLLKNLKLKYWSKKFSPIILYPKWRILKGVLLTNSSVIGTDIHKFIRLWVHEVYRVFYDRLIDDNDRNLFFNMVKETCKSVFKQPMEKVMSHLFIGEGLRNW